MNFIKLSMLCPHTIARINVSSITDYHDESQGGPARVTINEGSYLVRETSCEIDQMLRNLGCRMSDDAPVADIFASENTAPNATLAEQPLHTP